VLPSRLSVAKSTGLGNKRYDYSPGLTRLFFQTRARGFVAPRLQRYPSATVITLLAVWVIVPTQSPPVPRLGDELPSGTPPLRATPKFCGPAPKHLKSFVTKSTGLGNKRQQGKGGVLYSILFHSPEFFKHQVVKWNGSYHCTSQLQTGDTQILRASPKASQIFCYQVDWTW
jgi:hypothetical protein